MEAGFRLAPSDSLTSTLRAGHTGPGDHALSQRFWGPEDCSLLCVPEPSPRACCSVSTQSQPGQACGPASGLCQEESNCHLFPGRATASGQGLEAIGDFHRTNQGALGKCMQMKMQISTAFCSQPYLP